MDFVLAMVVLVVGLLVLLFAGIPVAFALLLSGILGFAVGAGSQGVQFIGNVLWEKTATYEFLAAPMFVYMGFLLQESGMIESMFRMITNWLGRLPGSLGTVTLAGAAVFSAMSGSASAACATLGTVMAPEVRRYGFSMRLMAGIINGGASLAPLIPPSVALIVYSTLTETSVTRLFAAGVVPGLLFLVLQMIQVAVVATLRPDLAPRIKAASWKERIVSLRVLPVVAGVIYVVLGGIYLGWFTPTESASIGVVLSMLVLAGYRGFRLGKVGPAIWRGSREASYAAVFIMALIVCGSVYSDVLNFLGVSQFIAGKLALAGFGRIQFLLLLSVVLFVMGAFLNAITIQVLVVPFVFPVLHTLNIDPVWFGIFLVTWIEIGTMTPPYGLDFFVLQGVMGVSYKDAVMGALPFIPVWLLGLALLILFPELALWLPARLL